MDQGLTLGRDGEVVAMVERWRQGVWGVLTWVLAAGWLAGCASPMPALTSREGSFVEASASTQKVMAPGSSFASPSARGTTQHRGGRMLDTRTRLPRSIPALRKASSKL